MKKLAFLLLLIGLGVWPVGLRAQSSALLDAHRQGAALYQAGRYDEALPFWKKALELGQREFGPEHPSTATALNNLAELYRKQGRYAKAEPLYKRSLAIVETTLGAAHPSTAALINNLAELYRVQGRYAKAEPLYKRSLAIREKVLGAEHPAAATLLNNLAQIGRASCRERVFTRV
jgi:tetratricopeptide (TPR) repeat protein